MAPENVRTLATILAMAAGAWVGGLATVTLVVVSTLKVGAAERVVLFRTFGRRFAAFFGVVGVFVVAPAVILAINDSGALTITIAVLSVTLLFATGGGIVQARRMTAMRTAVATGAVGEEALHANATVAAIIRALLVSGYVALLVLALLLVVSV